MTGNPGSTPGPREERGPGEGVPEAGEGRGSATAAFPELPRQPTLRGSPFVPAVVLLVLLAAAAGMFAGSYCAALANPTPRHIPTAVVGDSPDGVRLVQSLEGALNTSLALHRYPTYAKAREAVEEQREFAVLRLFPDRAQLEVASAAGVAVARVLTMAAPGAGAAVGVPVTVQDVKPLQHGDPQGLAMFYMALASVVIGFVGAIQFSVHAKALNAGERIAFTAAYALLGGLAVSLAVDDVLDVLKLPYPQVWLILALTMFTAGMTFTMFNTLVGRWAILPTWGLMVLLGNPSSGGAVAWPLLPPALAFLGRFLPPGACVNALRNAVYYPGHQHVEPLLVLGLWALIATTVFLVWRDRHPGGRVTWHAALRELHSPRPAAPAGETNT